MALQTYADTKVFIGSKAPDKLTITSADFATGMPTAEGAAEVISDFKAQLEGLENADASEVLASVQANLQAALDAAG